MALQEKGLLGTRPIEKERTETVDRASVRAGDPFFYAASRRLNQDRRDQEQRRNCFFCLEGWVFLGSIGHDGRGDGRVRPLP